MMKRETALSGYRIMWMMALFDLPTLTKEERQRAQKFRLYLLDEGFSMRQLSVYTRVTGGKQNCEALTKRIAKKVPKAGKVDIFYFTDKQFSNMTCFRGVNDEPPPQKGEQLVLF